MQSCLCATVEENNQASANTQEDQTLYCHFTLARNNLALVTTILHFKEKLAYAELENVSVISFFAVSK